MPRRSMSLAAWAKPQATMTRPRNPDLYDVPLFLTLW